MYSHKKAINSQARVMISKEINNYMGKPNTELKKKLIKWLIVGNLKVGWNRVIITWYTEEEFIGIQKS